MIYGLSQKKHKYDFGILPWISQEVNIVKSWAISQIKDDIHSYVLSTSSFCATLGSLRFIQNNTRYQDCQI